MNEITDITVIPGRDTGNKCISCVAEIKKDLKLLGFIYYLGKKPLAAEIDISNNGSQTIISAGVKNKWKIDSSVFKSQKARKLNSVLYWLPVLEKEFLHTSPDADGFEHKIDTGTSLDYSNTCREGQRDLPLFQNNVFFSIQNTGIREITIKDILINGKSWWTLEGILKDIGINPADETNSETVLKIWDFVRKKVSCGKTYQKLFNDEMSKISVIDFLNCLGSGACGTYSSILVLLCAAAGIPARRVSLSDGSHIISQVLLDNKDIVVDAFYGPDKEGEGIRGSFFVNNDHQLASYKELCNDHYIAHRAGRLNIGELASLFGYHDSFQSKWTESYTDEKSMDFVLYEDELIEWYLHPACSERDNPFRQAGRFRISGNLASGRYFTENLITQNNSVISEGLGTLNCRLELPYPINGVNLKISLFKGNIKVEIKTETGHIFNEYSQSADNESIDISIGMDERTHKALFGEMTSVLTITITSDDNTSYTVDEVICGFYSYNKSLMNMKNGTNTCRLVLDEAKSRKSLCVRHGYLEFPEIHAPDAPEISIKNNKIILRDITENKYEYIISEKSDCRIPVSPRHNGLADEKELSIESDGILCSGQKYYARARCINCIGSAGPWSKAVHFTFKSLPMPVPGRIECLSDGIEIHWLPVNSVNETVYYEVYGSREKGFIPSVKPYDVWVKRIDDPAISSKYPPNLIATTTENFIFIPFTYGEGPFPAHFRIRACTEKLKGPASEMISLATPQIIKSSIKSIVQAEQSYSCFVKTILSLGSLQFNRLPDKPMYTSFLEREIPIYELDGNPQWLQIRPEDGYLYGTPDKNDRGKYNFNIKCKTNNGESTVMVSIEIV